MKKTCLLFMFLSALFAQAQTDVLVLEKNGENVKTYAAGMEITMETIYNQWFTGTIDAIRHDSLFINGSSFHYKEIAMIRRERTKINYQTDGSLLMVAGAGVLLLGTVNGIYRKDPAKKWFTPAGFITAGSLLLLGFFVRKSQFQKYRIGKKFTLQYLALSAEKKG
jgi:hypothetical protein